MQPHPETLAAVGLPADTVVEPAGGATGRLWRVATSDQTFALRLFPSAEAAAGPLAAMQAAGAAGLPVADLLQQADTRQGHVVLCSWLPGIPLAEAARRDPTSARHLGVLLGEAQRELHGVRTPESLAPAVDTTSARTDAALPAPRAEGRALLHLDWHPLNVLVEDGHLSGVLDWDNARAGHPLLDLARTHALLRIDPALESLPAHDRTLLGEMFDGWATGYGPDATDPPAACLAWAGWQMLTDLSGRYAADPSALQGVRRWAEEWDRRARESSASSTSAD